MSPQESVNPVPPQAKMGAEQQHARYDAERRFPAKAQWYTPSRSRLPIRLIMLIKSAVSKAPKPSFGNSNRPTEMKLIEFFVHRRDLALP
jgi:hypothetical protein